jgi:REP element-mobilizing transposase RayT
VHLGSSLHEEKTIEFPLAYLITFTTYGSRLPGNERGWSNRKEFVVSETGSRPPDSRLEDVSATLQRQASRTLDDFQRAVVLAAIQEVCAFRDWELLAAHARTNHVHVVVSAPGMPKRIMADFKHRASFHLNQANPGSGAAVWWARHGSTKYLWKMEAVERAIRYTVLEQGAPMALHIQPGTLPDADTPITDIK